jgi:hypothetical protein
MINYKYSVDSRYSIDMIFWYSDLVGGKTTPLKNDGVHQLG